LETPKRRASEVKNPGFSSWVYAVSYSSGFRLPVSRVLIIVLVDDVSLVLLGGIVNNARGAYVLGTGRWTIIQEVGVQNGTLHRILIE